MSNQSNFTRRSVLKSVAALTAASAIPTLGYSQTSTPKRGGLLRIGHSGGATSDTINPGVYAAGPVVTAMLAVCNNLAEIDADGRAVPELAEALEPDATARVWTVKLRKGVTFSNGKALTPEDVIASFNFHRAENSTSSAKGILADVQDIRKDGNDVVFELKSSNADFPYLCTEYQFIIMPAKADGTLDWESGLGTGGYILESHEPGVRIKLKRRDDYWKEGRAWFDEVELLTINDATARQNSLLTGRVDVINSVDLKTLPLLQRRTDIRIDEVTGTGHILYPMWCDTPPFNNLDVRLALKYAIDRQELVDKVLFGHGQVANDSPIAPANRFYYKDMPQRVYDPEKAKFHLNKAGLSSLDVELFTAGISAGSVDASILYQASAKKCGININVKREPDDGYWSNIWLKKPFVTGYWNGRPSEDSMFSLVYDKNSIWNETHWDNERFQTLLVEGRSTTDDEKRRAIYYEMQQIVSDDGGAVIPLFLNYLDASSTKVAHGKLASDRFLDGWKIIERWWSAA